MAADAAPFVWPVRVYWEDTDAGGIVYYANYLKFMERARTEWLRAIGVDQVRLKEEHGLMFVVVDVEAHYRKPARYGDLLQVTLQGARDHAGQPDVQTRRSIASASAASCCSTGGCAPRASTRRATARGRCRSSCGSRSMQEIAE